MGLKKTAKFGRPGVSGKVKFGPNQAYEKIHFSRSSDSDDILLFNNVYNFTGQMEPLYFFVSWSPQAGDPYSNVHCGVNATNRIRATSGGSWENICPLVSVAGKTEISGIPKVPGTGSSFPETWELNMYDNDNFGRACNGYIIVKN